MLSSQGVALNSPPLDYGLYLKTCFQRVEGGKGKQLYNGET